MAKLGLKVAGEVTKWFMAPVQNSMPPVGPEWEAYKVDSWGDYSAWGDAQTPAVAPADLDVVSNADALDLVGGTAGAEATPEAAQAAGAVSSGAVEPAGAAPSSLSNLGTLTTGLASAAALMDMGFTIAGNQPDAAKAVNTALDAVIVVGVWIPVYGWAVALVAGIVKGVLGIFGSNLWGGGLSHQQREALEANRVLTEGAAPFGREVGQAMTPREAVTVFDHWTTHYCGGTSPYAVMAYLSDAATGHQLYFGSTGCYINTGKPYRDWPDGGRMTADDQALALARYGATDFAVSIQAGVTQSMLAPANVSLADMAKRKATAWREMLDHGLTLDGIDAHAVEQRKQPHLNAVATEYGYADWHGLVQRHLQDYWTRYVVTNRHGSLQDFGRRMGYSDWFALRDDVVADFDAYAAEVQGQTAAVNATIAWYQQYQQVAASAGAVMSTP